MPFGLSGTIPDSGSIRGIICSSGNFNQAAVTVLTLVLCLLPLYAIFLYVVFLWVNFCLFDLSLTHD